MIGPWSRSYGVENQGGDTAYCAATDKDGNVLVTGEFSHEINFGDGNHNGGVLNDAFVIKLDNGGELLWSKTFVHTASTTDSSSARACAFNNEGAAVVAGRFSGKLDLGDGELESTLPDGFLLVLDKDGNHELSRQFGGDGSDSVSDLAIDDDGNIVVVGTTNSASAFGPAGGDTDIFVTKYSASGELLASNRFGEAGHQDQVRVATDGNKVFLAGHFVGEIDMGAPGKLEATSSSWDLYVLRLDDELVPQAGVHFGDDQKQLCSGLAIGPDGALWLTGEMEGVIDFGGDSPLTVAGEAVYVIALEQDLTHRHSFAWTLDNVLAPRVAVDDGGVVLAMGYEGSWLIGGESLTSPGMGTCLGVALLDGQGKVLDARRHGDGSGVSSRGLALSSKRVLLAGSFAGGLDFGDGKPLAAGNGGDIWAASLARSSP